MKLMLFTFNQNQQKRRIILINIMRPNLMMMAITRVTLVKQHPVVGQMLNLVATNIVLITMKRFKTMNRLMKRTMMMMLLLMMMDMYRMQIIKKRSPHPFSIITKTMMTTDNNTHTLARLTVMPIIK